MAHIYFYLCLALAHNLFIFSAKEPEVVVQMRKSTQQHQRDITSNEIILGYLLVRLLHGVLCVWVCVCFDSWLFFAFLTESARIFIYTRIKNFWVHSCISLAVAWLCCVRLFEENGVATKQTAPPPSPHKMNAGSLNWLWTNKRTIF